MTNRRSARLILLQKDLVSCMAGFRESLSLSLSRLVLSYKLQISARRIIAVRSRREIKSHPWVSDSHEGYKILLLSSLRDVCFFQKIKKWLDFNYVFIFLKTIFIILVLFNWQARHVWNICRGIFCYLFLFLKIK